jgi:alpha-tubulin suppressor-like RCC1 family protein
MHQGIGCATIVLAVTAAACAGPDPATPAASRGRSAALSQDQGLLAVYFDNRDFTAQRTARVDRTIDFSWNNQIPSGTALTSSRDFSVRWSGGLTAATTGTYTLATRSDDGARVWIDGRLLIDDWKAHVETEKTASVRLDAQTTHQIVVEYFQASGKGSIRLLWKKPGERKLQPVPASALRPAVPTSQDAGPDVHGADGSAADRPGHDWPGDAPAALDAGQDAGATSDSGTDVSASEPQLLWGWGRGGLLLGRSRFDTSTNPAARQLTDPPRDFVQVAVSNPLGSGHTPDQAGLAVRPDGTVWGWGAKTNGVLIGADENEEWPQPRQLPGLQGISAVTVGLDRAVAIDRDGHVLAWGKWCERDADVSVCEQLGPTSIYELTPTFEAVPLTDIVSVSMTYTHALALRRDGVVYTFGDNNTYEVGDKYHTRIARRVRPIPPAASVAAGVYHDLVIDRQGTVWAWGSNHEGAIGNPEAGYHSSTPVRPVGLGRARMVAAFEHSLAALEDGSIWAWGRNTGGRLGDGTTVDRPVPTQIGDLSGNITALQANRYVSGAILDGELWLWGSAWFGELGDPAVAGPTTPARMPLPRAPSALALSEFNSFVLMPHGASSCKAAPVPGQYIVDLASEATPAQAQVNALAEQYPLSVRHVYEETRFGFSAAFDADTHARLRADPRVAAIVPNLRLCQTAGPRSPSVRAKAFALTTQAAPLALRRIGASTDGLGQTMKHKGAGVRIAVIDSGIDGSHPDLRVTGGRNFRGDSSALVDDNGHGTMVAGAIAALDNGIGTVGVAPDAELVSLKVCSGTSCFSDDAYDALDWIVGQRRARPFHVACLTMDLIQIAEKEKRLGSDRLAWTAAQLRKAGVVFVAGSSNDGLRAPTPNAFDDLVVVSGFRDLDGWPRGRSGGVDDTFDPSSGSGLGMAISAPDQDVQTTRNSTDVACPDCYGVASGTSMAAALVAGAAAVLRSASPTAPAEEIKRQLLAMAEPGPIPGDPDQHPEGMLRLREELMYAGLLLSPSVHVLDPRSHSVVTTIDTSPTPGARVVEVSRDGRTAYVGGRATPPRLSDLIAIDTARNQIVERLPLDGTPWAMTSSADSRRLFVATSASQGGLLQVIDTQHAGDPIRTMRRLAEIPIGCAVGARTKLSPDGLFLYVRTSWDSSCTFGGSDEVLRIDTRTNQVKTRYRRGAWTWDDLALSPDGGIMYLLSGGEGCANVVKVDVQSAAILGELELPCGASESDESTVLVSVDGGTLLIPGEGRIRRVDTTSLTELPVMDSYPGLTPTTGTNSRQADRLMVAAVPLFPASGPAVVMLLSPGAPAAMVTIGATGDRVEGVGLLE